MADNIEKIIKLLENQNSRLEDLINENKRLNNTPFDMTSIERINKLSEEVADFSEKFNNSFNESSKNFNGLFKDKKNLIKDIEQATEELKKKTGDDYENSKKCLEDLLKSAENYYKYSNKEQEALNKRIVEGTTPMDDFTEKWSQRTKAIRKGTSDISRGFKQIYQSITKTLEPWSKANHAAMQYAKTMGMSQKTADAYLKSTVSWASKNNIGLLFNKTSEELIKMQGKYSEVLGRNVKLTSEQKKDMLAMEAIIGEDNMMDIANNLENFGMGMSDSAAFVKKTFDTATKSGIAASKLTKTIQENIKRAQNYTFKNGLDGLTSMAKKAIQLKTDMSLVDGFIDKTSTVEGAISTGANLQVLGGSYAMGSDPLSMLYDSLNNVEGMFDRAVGMAQGKVFYNDKTGNFEMGAMDRYMMKQAATQMGVDPSKMIDVAFRKASLDKIEGQVKSNSKISGDKDMVELVKNLATWDNGNAVVNIDGKDVAVKDLTSKDKEKLEAMQRTDSQNLQEMAINLRSMNDIMSGVQKEKDNEQANLMRRNGEKLTNLLKNNTNLLNTLSKIGAIGTTIVGIGGQLSGIWYAVNGIWASMIGTRNVIGRGGGIKPTGKRKGGFSKTLKTSSLRTSFRGLKGNVIESVGKNGKVNKWISLGDGTFKNAENSKILQVKASENLLKGSSKMVKMGGLAKTVTGVGAGVLSAGLSIAKDAASGELKKDTGASIGRAAGSGIGAGIGTFVGSLIPIPGMSLVGGMVGQWIGSIITDSIQNEQKNTRDKVRKEISDRLSGSMSNVAELFDGENALVGNYKKKHLEKLEEALKDGVLDAGEIKSRALLKKLRANDDLNRIRQSGAVVNEKFADGGIIGYNKQYDNGGILHGKSHANGGMPILGSNIVVEGGEFVINKKATRLNLPLLEKINSGDFKMEAREPLGKQLKVNKRTFGEDSISSRKSSVNIEPISINLSGTIKLDAGNKQFDISNEILNNPQLISKLTEMINRQINILDNGAYNKGKFLQKFA